MMNLHYTAQLIAAASITLASVALAQAPAQGGNAVSVTTETAVPVTSVEGTSASASQASTGGVMPASQADLGEVAAVGADVKEFSFGHSNLSILFLPKQMDSMKEAIIRFETDNVGGTTTTVVVAEAEAVPVDEKIIVEPTAYPVFFLSSIVYEAPNDWSLWMGGQKITSRKNDTEVVVLSVTRDSATFRWKPDYLEAIAKRKNSDAFAPIDSVKNKLAGRNTVSYDEQAGHITFTLRQNQSFALGYFNIFEGYVPAPELEPLKASVANLADDDGAQTEKGDQLPFAGSSSALEGLKGMPRTATMPTGAMVGMPAKAN